MPTDWRAISDICNKFVHEKCSWAAPATITKSWPLIDWGCKKFTVKNLQNDASLLETLCWNHGVQYWLLFKLIAYKVTIWLHHEHTSVNSKIILDLSNNIGSKCHRKKKVTARHPQGSPPTGLPKAFLLMWIWLLLEGGQAPALRTPPWVRRILSPDPWSHYCATFRPQYALLFQFVRNCCRCMQLCCRPIWFLFGLIAIIFDAIISFLLSSSYALLSINLLGSSSAAFVFRLLADQKLRGPTSNDRLHGSFGSQSYWTGFTGSLMLGETLRLLFGCLGPANYRSRHVAVGS